MQDAARAVVPRAAWAFADCRTTPFPGTPDPDADLRRRTASIRSRSTSSSTRRRIRWCSASAWRRRATSSSFFRHAAHGRARHARIRSPALIDHAVAIGDSQSGNFIKTFVHLGFNEDAPDRIVWDGVFPRIAARQTPINFRFALPGGAATLYEPGSEPVVWWGRYEDRTRGRAAASLLDRCTATQHLPEGHRGVRLDRVLGAADVART